MAVCGGSTFTLSAVERNRAPPSELPNDVLTKYEVLVKELLEKERKQIDEEAVMHVETE